MRSCLQTPPNTCCQKVPACLQLMPFPLSLSAQGGKIGEETKICDQPTAGNCEKIAKGLSTNREDSGDNVKFRNLEDEFFNGQDVDSDQDPNFSGSFLQILDLTSNEAAGHHQLQVWGTPWSPEEFLQMAAQAGHPASFRSFLPPRPVWTATKTCLAQVPCICVLKFWLKRSSTEGRGGQVESPA